mgnify:CR=1 FL=1|tara:strand:+ start:58 stop:315 length:258 start_codon:yes stop_codon:yes gene_type:complete
MNVIQKPTVLLEKFPYRYIQSGTLDNGKPDCQLQKMCSSTRRYKTIYSFDNELQMMTAMEDYDYTIWLDPDGGPCYVRDKVSKYS